MIKRLEAEKPKPTRPQPPLEMPQGEAQLSNSFQDTVVLPSLMKGLSNANPRNFEHLTQSALRMQAATISAAARLEVAAMLEDGEEGGQNLIEGLWQLFARTDIDKKGTLSSDEFANMIKNHWMSLEIRDDFHNNHLTTAEVHQEINDSVEEFKDFECAKPRNANFSEFLTIMSLRSYNTKKLKQISEVILNSLVWSDGGDRSHSHSD
jgi:hypothetical protein